MAAKRKTARPDASLPALWQAISRATAALSAAVEQRDEAGLALAADALDRARRQLQHHHRTAALEQARRDGPPAVGDRVRLFADTRHGMVTAGTVGEVVEVNNTGNRYTDGVVVRFPHATLKTINCLFALRGPHPFVKVKE